MTISLATFSLTGDNEQIILPLPETLSWGSTYNVPLYNFLGDTITVRNKGKTDEPLTLNGVYQGFSSSITNTFEQYWSSIAWASIYLKQFQGQTFTVGARGENTYHQLSHVSIFLKKSSVYSVSAATVIFVNLKYTLTGDIISSGTLSASALNTTGSYHNVTMSPSILLCPNTSYSFLVGSTATNSARIYMSLTPSGTYTGGLNYYSTDGGLSWTVYTGYDARFGIRGTRDETPYSILGKLDGMLGEEFTIKGFGDTDLDNTWVISNLNYTVNEGEPYTVNWSLSLEKT